MEEKEKSKKYMRKSKTLMVQCGHSTCTAPPMTEQSLRRHLLNQHGKGVTQKGQKTVPSIFANKLAGGGVKRDASGELKQQQDPVGQSNVFDEAEGDEADLNENIKDVTASKEDKVDVKKIFEEFFEGTLKSAVKETVESTMKEVLSGKKEEEKKLSIQVKVKPSKDLMSKVRSVQGI